ncbi:GntR family transcriptional repressor for pyruvate dehydrogenase complex [Caldicoprobacter guelmensis]|uniref:FadR/GntR family transcriptional regulator n=1 Tax=Caldicoprobacter guelmensis TaxID=1170224 RepID=UPI001959B70B|nr:FadR/GntR family transcriptional regulator [Caldicoprobacter guelmensis]MBM7583402.1 GntR family transcriptional repressor for pyruvate dehydrogenase complex [Caldicoprobacter guelmensis]
MVRAIKKNSVREQVVEELKRQIINKNWLPGTKIPSENELAALLQVSRVTVREALQQLITLGLLETRQGEGTFVKELLVDSYMNSLIPYFVLDIPQLMQILEYRKLAEPAAMSLVVERATKEDIRKLEYIFKNMMEKQNDVKKFAQEDLNFHLALGEITRNAVIVKVNYVIRDILSVAMDYIVQYLGTRDGLYYHEKIISSIKDKDVERAQKFMAEHIEETIRKISQIEKNIKITNK